MENQMLIRLKHDKARNLLQDLEDLKIIEVIDESPSKKVKISQIFQGFLSKEEGKDLTLHINKSRAEWSTI